MREMIARRASRFAAVAMAFAIVSVLGGCGSMVPNWDPTDIFDFLDTKKKAPGERKPVFPGGVPGMTQGVPKEMVRGSPESRAAAEAQAAASSLPPPSQPAAPPPAKRARTAAKQPPAQSQSQVEIAPDDVNVEDEPPPPPPPRRQAQKRAAQPEVDPEQQANPFKPRTR